MRDLTAVTTRFNDIVLEVLAPIRMSKTVDRAAMGELHIVLDELAHALRDEDDVPKKLTGELWYVFTSMLAEAGHAADPELITSAAWEVQEKLELIFGPL
jgi:hypothetical protein